MMHLPRGVRQRTTIVATVIVAVVLGLAAVVLTSVLRSNLVNNLGSLLVQQAGDRAALISGGADPSTLLDLGDREAFVMVLIEGTMFGTDAVEVDWLGCETAASFPCTVRVILPEDGESEWHSARVAMAEFGTGEVRIGAEIEDIDRTVSFVRWASINGVLALVGVIAYLIWIVVGRVLAPVEAIRAEAASIHGGSRDARVPASGNGDEIDRLAGTVNAMLERISQDAAIRRQFASDASHELKSPLANLRVMIDTAQGEEWTRVSSTVAAKVDRMGALVDNLLFLAVLDEGASDVGDNRVHLDDLAFDEVEVAAAASDHVIDANGVQPAVILGDADQLRRAVRNVIDNAVRYARGGVRVRTSLRNGTVSLVVEDDGPGIPAESRATVFERFGRVDDSRTRRTGSTGLGLAIAHEIVSRHGGSIMVGESDLGGARFIFEFPEA